MSRFSSLTLIALTLVLAPVLAGCDRQSSPPAQPTAETTTAGTGAEEAAPAPAPSPDFSPAAAPSPVAAASPTPDNAGGGELSGAVDRSHKGSRVPSITVKDGSGRQLALEQVKGPMLVNLWATWCAPCVVELPMLDKVAGEQAGRLTVVTVSQDVSGMDKVPAFLSAKGGNRLKPWLDPDNTLADHYATGVLPTTVLYDRNGREVWRVVGGLDWSSPEGRKLVAEAIG